MAVPALAFALGAIGIGAAIELVGILKQSNKNDSPPIIDPPKPKDQNDGQKKKRGPRPKKKTAAKES